jgi:hypothetical protein
MPYVRRYGRQVALVHGERERGSGRVLQRVLFTLCTQAEAAAFVTESESDPASLAHRLEEAYPRLKFDWPELRAAVERWLPSLPEQHTYPVEDASRRLDRALADAGASLLLLDPRVSAASHEALERRRSSLRFLREWVDLRLQQLDGPDVPDEDPFDWSLRIHGTDAPAEARAQLAALHAAQGPEEAAALASELLVSFPAFAEAHAVLGEAAERRNDVAVAAEHLHQAVALASRRGAPGAGAARWAPAAEKRDVHRWWVRLGELYLRSSQFERAVEVATRLDDVGLAGPASWIRGCVEVCDPHNLAVVGHAMGSGVPFLGAIVLHRSGNQPEALRALALSAMESTRVTRILLDLRLLRARTDAERDEQGRGESMRRCLQAVPDRVAWTATFTAWMQSEAMVAAIGEALARRGRDGQLADYADLAAGVVERLTADGAVQLGPAPARAPMTAP